MIFKIPFLISHISSMFTLLEGDVILTGKTNGFDCYFLSTWFCFVCLLFDIFIRLLFNYVNRKCNVFLVKCDIVFVISMCESEDN